MEQKAEVKVVFLAPRAPLVNDTLDIFKLGSKHGEQLNFEEYVARRLMEIGD